MKIKEEIAIPLLWVEPTFKWYESAAVFRVLILIFLNFFCFEFLSRTNGKKEHLHENNLCHRYGFFGEIVALKVTWS